MLVWWFQSPQSSLPIKESRWVPSTMSFQISASLHILHGSVEHQRIGYQKEHIYNPCLVQNHQTKLYKDKK